jgi:hypothetical protein
MDIHKLKWTVVPIFFAITIGVLEIIHAPLANGFPIGSLSHLRVGGRSAADGIILLGFLLIMLVLCEMFVLMVWSKIGGFLFICLGVTLVMLSFNFFNQEVNSSKMYESSVKRKGKSIKSLIAKSDS